jgi:hypothetical protein
VLYETLVRLCEEVKPEALILGGDFLHGTGLLPYGRTRQRTPTQCAVEFQGVLAPEDEKPRAWIWNIPLLTYLAEARMPRVA